MAAALVIFVIASLLTQGLALPSSPQRSIVEITLADEFYEFITNPWIGKTVTIPKFFLDTLESCHVIFPNGQMLEAYPNNQLPTGTGITFLEAVQPFTSCGIGFVGVSVSASGTYELVSLVHHNAENYKSLTRQKFHMTFIESSGW